MKNAVNLAETGERCMPGDCDVHDTDVCHCQCHDPEVGHFVNHTSPCCHDCPHCGQMIKMHALLAHVGPCLKAKKARASLGTPPSLFTEAQQRTLADHPETFDDVSHVG